MLSRIAIKEFKTNAVFFALSILSLSVLLSIIAVLGNLVFQLPAAYSDKFQKDSFVVLKSENNALLSTNLEDFFVYGRIDGLTYNTKIVHNDNAQNFPSYVGGVCVFFVCDKVDVLPRATSGETFSKNEHAIWLADELAALIECQVGDDITLNEETLSVVGTFSPSDLPDCIAGNVSFLIYRTPHSVYSGSFFVTATDAEQLLRLSELPQDLLDDEEGLLSFCRGYKSFLVGLDVIVVILEVLFVALLIGLINVYFIKRENVLRVIRLLGSSKAALVGEICVIFAIVGFIACVLASVASLGINYLITTWAENILGVVYYSHNIFLVFCLEFVCCLIILVVAATISIFGRNKVMGVDNK